MIANLNKESVLLEIDDHGKTIKKIVMDRNYEDEIYWWNPIVVENKLYVFSMNKPVAYIVDAVQSSIELMETVVNAIGEIPTVQGKYLIRLIGRYRNTILFITGWNKKGCS